MSMGSTRSSPKPWLGALVDMVECYSLASLHSKSFQFHTVLQPVISQLAFRPFSFSLLISNEKREIVLQW